LANHVLSLHRDTPPAAAAGDEEEEEDWSSSRSSLSSNEVEAQQQQLLEAPVSEEQRTVIGHKRVSPIDDGGHPLGPTAKPSVTHRAVAAAQQSQTELLLRLAIAEEVESFTPSANRNFPDVVPKSHRQLRWNIQHGQASLHSHSAKITAQPPPQVMAERLRQQKDKRMISHSELRRAILSHRVGVAN
jgi:hypothetical protein